eukprot:6180830-Pleurochrysis_carterae.AAC.2
MDRQAQTQMDTTHARAQGHTSRCTRACAHAHAHGVRAYECARRACSHVYTLAHECTFVR